MGHRCRRPTMRRKVKVAGQSACSCAVLSVESLPVPSQEPTAAINKQPTTTIELVSLLGYTFQAHSCAAQTEKIETGGSPLRQSRKGVDQAM